jgi:hypothetical protein
MEGTMTRFVWTCRVFLCAIFLLMLSISAAAAGQGAKPTAGDEGERRAFQPQLIGSWRSASDRMPLSTDLDRSVWGAGAAAVRDVSLTIRSSGEGTLTITRKIVDARGRTAQTSTSIEEAQVVVEGPLEAPAGRMEHAVRVVRAERRYPDDPSYKWPLEGLQVKVATFDDNDDAIEVRVDTPEGRGSFWETLRRQGRRSPRVPNK